MEARANKANEESRLKRREGRRNRIDAAIRTHVPSPARADKKKTKISRNKKVFEKTMAFLFGLMCVILIQIAIGEKTND